MGKLAGKTEGTVSLYLILAVTVLVFFQAVLADYVRVEAAQIRNDRVAQAAVRSVLSRYDTALRPYGLFAVRGSRPEMAATAEQVTRLNLPAASAPGAVRWAGPIPAEGGTSVAVLGNLADIRLFERQVLEVMKYEAPAAWSLRLADAFKQAAEQGAATDHLLKETDTLEQWIAKRDKALDDAWSVADKIHARIADGHERYAEAIARIRTLRAEIAGQSLEALQAQIRALSAAPPAGGEDAGRAWAAALADLQRRLQALLAKMDELARTESKIKRDASRDASMLQELNAEWQSAMGEASSYNRRLAARVAELAKNQPGSRAKWFEQVPVFKESYFASRESETAAVVSLFAGFVSAAEKDPGGTAASAGSDRCMAASAEWHAKTEAEGRRRKAERDKVNREQQKAEDQTKSAMQQAAALVDPAVCAGTSPQYERLTGPEGIAARYEAAALPPTPSNAPSVGGGTGAAAYGKGAVSLLSGLDGMLGSLRDKALIDEYALSRFTDRVSPAQPAGHALSGQESEYLLYGFSGCRANLDALAGELFAIRTAIRTAEALLDPRTAAGGSPLLVFLLALAEGAAKALEDVKQLLDGKEVALSEKFSRIRLTYTDYLRAFLLMHGNQDHILRRMMALIDLNTGRDLRQAACYVQVRTESGLRLWFLPAVWQAVDRTVRLPGEVRGHDYVMRTAIAMSY